MDARCVLLAVLCARLPGGGGDVGAPIATDTGNIVSPPVPEIKKEVFMAEIKSNLQKDNEDYDYEGSSEDGEWRLPDGGGVVNRSVNARRRAPPPHRPRAPHSWRPRRPPRNRMFQGMWRQGQVGQVEGKQARGEERAGERQGQGDMEERGRKEMAGEKQEIIRREWSGHEGREQLRGDEAQSLEKEREGENERSVAHGAIDEPQGEGAATDRDDRPTRGRGLTARANRGVRMTSMQELAVDVAEERRPEVRDEAAPKAGGAGGFRQRRVTVGEVGGAAGAESAGGGGDDVKGVVEGGGGEGSVDSKVEKLRAFLRNNKDLLKKFILQKRKQRQMTASSPSLTPPRRDLTLGPPATYTPMAPVGELMGRHPRPAAAAAGGLRAGARGAGVEGALPTLSARALDMGHARGSRVAAMRQRNRLCQRNVLMPEGPKYDSKGAVYLLAYNRSRYSGREYSQTRPPKLLLPACCNCCKKSVLGCE